MTKRGFPEMQGWFDAQNQAGNDTLKAVPLTQYPAKQLLLRKIIKKTNKNTHKPQQCKVSGNCSKRIKQIKQDLFKKLY